MLPLVTRSHSAPCRPAPLLDEHLPSQRSLRPSDLPVARHWSPLCVPPSLMPSHSLPSFPTPAWFRAWCSVRISAAPSDAAEVLGPGTSSPYPNPLTVCTLSNDGTCRPRMYMYWERFLHTSLSASASILHAFATLPSIHYPDCSMPPLHIQPARPSISPTHPSPPTGHTVQNRRAG